MTVRAVCRDNMSELIDKAYAYVEKTLEENYSRHQKEISKTKSFIRYDRFYHIQRVTAWAERIADELCAAKAERNDAISDGKSAEACVPDKDSLMLASVLHDVGYHAYHISENHAEAGVVLAEQFLSEAAVPEVQKAKILDLIRRHSSKELMFLEDTPLELVILMEADLMDDMGASGLVMDTWINTRMHQEETSFDTIFAHMQKYTQVQQREEPMRTEPAKRFWREKQELVEEFMRQFARDLNR